MKTNETAISAALNSARICEELPAGVLSRLASIFNLYPVAMAAARLAQIERAPGFEWEAQRNDWESVCAAIAAHISNPAAPRMVAPTLAQIRRIISAKL